MIGNFGDAEVFSFHATKFFNTFEGGAIATNDVELARRVQRMRNFGFCRARPDGCAWHQRQNERGLGRDGPDQPREPSGVLETNRRNYLAYRRGLDAIAGFRMLEYDSSEKRNYQYIVSRD